MFENGKFPTIEELLERGEHLIQKAVDGKRWVFRKNGGF